MFFDQEFLHVAQSLLPELHVNGLGGLWLKVCLSPHGFHRDLKRDREEDAVCVCVRERETPASPTT